MSDYRLELMRPKGVKPIPVHLVGAGDLARVRKLLSVPQKAWIKAHDFTGSCGTIVVLPGATGKPERVFAGLSEGGDGLDIWLGAKLADALPPGLYQLEDQQDRDFLAGFSIAWGLSAYRFDRYRKNGAAKPKDPGARLLVPADVDMDEVTAIVSGICLSRDLINTPAEDMGPEDLFDAAEKLAKSHKGQSKFISGNGLLEAGYPAIFTVGRASHRPPGLIDLRWGPSRAPKVTLVGKGVCFDTGGLDLKPSGAMRLMKKDMGGAATVLGLASVIMALKVPVRLRVLIPAVDNAVSGNAFRPGDVVRTRKGLGIEVGNTDAEGRVVLADALTEACSESPDLLLDLATLTGAARVALGPDLPALFTDDDDLADGLLNAGISQDDPVWRLPLWQPYRRMINSPVADINNAGDSPFAGAITAALFLKEFVDPDVRWAHIDTFAWNPTARPGRPLGGEALTLRTLFAFIRQYVGQK